MGLLSCRGADARAECKVEGRPIYTHRSRPGSSDPLFLLVTAGRETVMQRDAEEERGNGWNFWLKS